MRIVIVTHKFTNNDGQGRVNFELARHLSFLGHSVHLISAEVAPELSKLDGVTCSRALHGILPSAALRDLWFGIHAGSLLRRLREPDDIVIFNGAIAFGASDINVAHFVHHGWRASRYYDVGRGIRGLYQRAYTWLGILLERFAFRAASHLVAVSSQVAGELIAAGQPARKIEVITNGVDTGEFSPGAVSRATLGLPEHGMLALFAGGLGIPRKNLDTVLRALTVVPDLHLVVAGRHGGTPYPALARELGVDDRVHFLSFRRDVPSIMRACDFFVFPSRYEACSLVLLEAMASGLPVVTARTAGGSELVTEGAGVVIDDPNDVEAVAGAMRLVMTDVTTEKAMSAEARRVAEGHDWSKMAMRYLDLCQRIAEERRS